MERSALKEHWKRFRPIVREILLGDVDHGGNHGVGGGKYGESVLRFYGARREELYRAVRQRKEELYRAGAGSSSTGADFDRAGSSSTGADFQTGVAQHPEMEDLHVGAGIVNSTTTSMVEEPPRPREDLSCSQPQHDAPSPRPVASEEVISPDDTDPHEDYTTRQIRMMKQAATSCVVPFDCSKGPLGGASCVSLRPLFVAEGFPTAYWEGFPGGTKREALLCRGG